MHIFLPAPKCNFIMESEILNETRVCYRVVRVIQNKWSCTGAEKEVGLDLKLNQ